jgi:4-amino-4-deoxy-L-arabinose transferase-like glycosyltransferase
MTRSLWKQPLWHWGISLLWVGVICWIAFGWKLGSTGLVDETEPLFAEAARQMTVTGDWITPYFNGETRFDKPPLVYWLMAIAYQVVGVNAWGARLPSALAAMGLTVMGFITLHYFGSRFPVLRNSEQANGVGVVIPMAGWIAAWIGAAAIACNPQTIAWARTGVSDMLLSACIGSSLLAFFWGYALPVGNPAKPRWYLAFYILSALAVLTKGPVGIVLPGLIILAFLLYMGNLRTVLAEMQPIRGGLLFLLLSVPWYILVYLANGQDYIDSFFGYHNFERFTSVVNNHSAPWYFYFLVVLIGFAPWSVHLPVAIARLRFWNLTLWRSQPRETHLGIFALVWFLVIFGFFTVAVTKLPSYVLPLLPAAGILVALFWTEIWTTRSSSTIGIQISHWANVLFCAVVAWAVVQSPNWVGGDPAMPDFPAIIQASGLVSWSVAIWSGVAIACAVLLWQRQGRWIWLANLFGLLCFILLVVMPVNHLVDTYRQLPLRELSATIVEQQQPDEEIIMMGFKKPTVAFYTQRPITYLSRPRQVRQRLQDIRRETGGRSSALILGEPHDLEAMDIPERRLTVLDQQGTYELIRVEL